MTRGRIGSSTRPRVLLSGHLPPPAGGIATYCQSLLSSSLGDKVDLCFVQTSSQTRAVDSRGRGTISNVVSAFIDCGRFARAVRDHRPHISHITTAHGLSFLKHSICVVIARIMGSRVLLHPHCSFQKLYIECPRWWRWLFRCVARLTEGILALSTEWNQVSSFMDVTVYQLPNAVDLGLYRAAGQENLARRSGNGALRVLYVGYLSKAKGSLDLVEAAHKVLSEGGNVHFDLVGDSLTRGDREQLSERIHHAHLGQRVRMHAPVFGPEKVVFFRKADVFIYPSYHEGMPMAVLEAMACALPIVATRVGGLPDLVTDEVNGLLVEPGRPDQLALAVQRLFKDEALRHRMMQKSYQFAVERYDVEQRVTQLVGIYKAVLSGLRPQEPRLTER